MIRLGYRPGGHVKLHLDIAKRWLRGRKKLLLTGDQLSAAAIQVVWYKRNGGHVEALPGIKLFFHINERPYLGKDIRDGWYRPEDFGIRIRNG